ncbi:hypothetical protein M9Y10_015912 [Tritrichomonas musculus]|uniref:Uncharacterized protein n=1 Tax=Tritrichomonas musculus TaxID=1915356 RepID=A0ABR2I6P1_9EUKA
MSRLISYNINPDINVQTGADKTYFPVRGWKLTGDEITAQTVNCLKTRGFYFNPANNHFAFMYPQEFVSPSNVEKDKYIIFQYCRCTVDGSISGEVEVHANFVPRDNYCDSLVYYANLQVPDDNRKYKVNSNRKQGFEVWFTDGKGDGTKTVIPDDFVLFLKLIY